MSPLERNNPKLVDLELDASGVPPNLDEEETLEEETIEEPEVEEDLDDADDFEEETDAAPSPPKKPKKPREPGLPNAFVRLYRGQTSFDFVGRKRWWFIFSATIIIAGLGSLGFRGLNLGIDFKGGTSWTVLAHGVTQTQATNAVTAAGLNQPVVELLGQGSKQELQIQADLNGLPSTEQNNIKDRVSTALGDLTGHQSVSQNDVGPTWGGTVTSHALTALIVFFIVVVIYISFRFEPKMAAAAFLAMVHDLLVTIGVYSLFGLQVSPNTVIAILTILGYSLYDTVVVFDRVRENTKGFGASGRMTYSEMINLSMNQTMARSINTSLVAILPVLAVLVIGAELLGAITLQDYGLALVVGLLSGAYSSIFIAAPLLAVMKEREPRYQAVRQRLESRGERAGVLTPSAAALLNAGPTADRGTKSGGRSGTIRPGAARAGSSRAGAGQARAKANGAQQAPARASGAGSSRPAGSRPTGAGGTRKAPPRPRKKKRR